MSRTGNLFSLAFVRHHKKLIASIRRLVETENFQRNRWTRLGDRLFCLIGHRADLANALAGQHKVAFAQRALLH